MLRELDDRATSNKCEDSWWRVVVVGRRKLEGRDDRAGDTIGENEDTDGVSEDALE